MVLTKHELLIVADFGPPYCWEDAGGKFAEFAPRFRHSAELNELSDATRQLHLGMESYAAWHEKDMEKLTRRLQRPSSRPKRNLSTTLRHSLREFTEQRRCAGGRLSEPKHPPVRR